MVTHPQPLEPLTSPMPARPDAPVVIEVRRGRAAVAIDLFANAALRWLCRGHASPCLRVVAVDA